MSFVCEIKKDIVLLSLEFSEINSANAAEVKLKINQIYKDGYRKNIINIDAVQFTDSTGLGALFPS